MIVYVRLLLTALSKFSKE